MATNLKDKFKYFGEKSNSFEFNYYLSLLIADFNELISESMSVKSASDAFSTIILNSKIQDLSDKVIYFKKKTDSYEQMLNAKDSSKCFTVDFLNPVKFSFFRQGIDLNDLYRDPKKNSLIFNNLSFAYVDRMAKTLSPGINGNPVALASYFVQESPESGTFGTAYDNYYFIKRTADPLVFNIIINLRESSSINRVELNTYSAFPFNISKVSYLNAGTWTTISGISYESISERFSFSVPTITCSSLSIEIKLPKSRYSSFIAQKEVDRTVRLLLQNAGLYTTFPEYIPGTTNSAYYYIFQFGLTSVSVFNNEYTLPSVYVGEPFEVTEPSSISLKAEYAKIGTDTKAEFYVLKADYSKEGLIRKELIPLRDSLSESSYSEVLVIAPGSITISPEDNKPNTAKISFLANEASIVVKQDGSVFSSDNWTYHDEYGVIEITANYNTSKTYTAEYTPLYTEENGIFPKDVINTSEVKTIFFDMYEGVYDSENKILNFNLPHLFNPDTITVRRFFNNEDSESSILEPEILSANTHYTLSGRLFSLLNYNPEDVNDVSAPSKRISIEGNLIGYTEETNRMIFYNKDHSAIIKWETFYNTLYNRYFKTQFYPIVVFRKSNNYASSVSNPTEIEALNFYVSTFNDLLKTAKITEIA